MPVLYLVALVVGLFTVVSDIALQAFVPSVVERETLVRANSSLEISRSVARSGGPTLAGLMIQIVTAPMAIFLNALSFGVSALLVLSVQRRETKRTKNTSSIWREAWDGATVVLQNPLLRAIAACSATSNFFIVAIGALYILYATTELGVQPGLLGIILTLGGVGAVAGATFAARFSTRIGIGPAIGLSALLNGAGALLVPLGAGSLVLVFASLAAAQLIQGLATPFYNITQLSLRQSITAAEQQGRMNATMRTIVWGTMPLGAIWGGLFAEAFGLRTTLYVCAVGMMASSLFIFFSPVGRLRIQPEAR